MLSSYGIYALEKMRLKVYNENRKVSINKTTERIKTEFIYNISGRF